MKVHSLIDPGYLGSLATVVFKPVLGSSFTYQMPIVSGASYAVQSGSLPNGLSVNSSGLISGTLTLAGLLGGSNAGNYSTVIRATGGTPSPQDFSLTFDCQGVSITTPTVYVDMDSAHVSGATLTAQVGPNATLIGSPSNVTGNVGEALKFVAASSQAATWGSIPEFDISGEDFSVSCTVKMDVATADARLLTKKQSTESPAAGYTVGVYDAGSSTAHTFVKITGLGGTDITDDHAVPGWDFAKFHQVQFIFERTANNLSVWADGAVNSTHDLSSLGTSSVANSNPADIARIDATSETRFGDATVDEFAFWKSHILSTNESGTLYWLFVRQKSLKTWLGI